MAKKALGMGIGALLGDGEQTVNPRDVNSISIDLIEPSKNQPRKSFNDDSLKDMAESIRVHGIIQPIIVESQGSRFVIVAGERRFRAARLAGMEKVPVIVREFSDDKKLEIALIENVQREDLNPLEEAEAYRQIMEKGDLSQADLASRVGKQRSTIANSLRLLKLPGAMKKALAEGLLTPGHARALLSVENPERQKHLFDRIVTEGLSVREAEALAEAAGKPAAKQIGTKKKHTSAGGLNAEMKDLQERMIEALGTKVVIRGNESRGSVEISYFSMEDLERIYELIRPSD